MTTAEATSTEVETPVPAPTFKFHDTATLPDGEVVIVRLPNQFQHEDISLKAAAAQARRMRQLRDPEADAYVVLEADMDDLQRAGEREPLIDELVGRDWWKDHFEAIKDVQERDEFKTIDEDMTRLEALSAKPEEERPAEEFGELERHVAAYNEAVKAARDERSAPRRRAFEDKDITDLIADVREGRIAAEGKNAYNRAFTTHEIALGTFRTEKHGDDKLHPTTRYFASVEDVEAADPEVLSVLTAAFGALEQQFNRGTVGNG
jgi:hypothetical protein